MTSPVPGVTYPSPRTWSAGDDITTPRLRGDMYNMAALQCTARPVLQAVGVELGFTVPSGSQTPLDLALANINTWNVAILPNGPASLQPYYPVPLAGWYLCEGNLALSPQTGPGQSQWVTGILTETGAIFSAGAALPGPGPGTILIGGTAAELLQLDTGHGVGIYAYQDSGSNAPPSLSHFKAEWVGLPSPGFSDSSVPSGSVIASPPLAAPFPPGPGTYITSGSGIAAGGSVVQVASAAGIVASSVIGLDYHQGQYYQPYAEAGTVSSVAGTTLTLSGTVSFAHAQNAPVAVPVGSAWLNRQDRDLINFLAYPPMLRAETTTTQSVASTSFPPTPGGNPSNQVTNLAVPGGVTGIDNFSGFASNAYTFPVPGVYWCYGQVFYAGSTSAMPFGAGLSVNSGTILWGTVSRSNTTGGAQPMCATVRRMLRVAAGQKLTLWAYQGSGSSVSTVATTNAAGRSYSRLIVVFRSL